MCGWVGERRERGPWTERGRRRVLRTVVRPDGASRLAHLTAAGCEQIYRHLANLTDETPAAEQGTISRNA